MYHELRKRGTSPHAAARDGATIEKRAFTCHSIRGEGSGTTEDKRQRTDSAAPPSVVLCRPSSVLRRQLAQDVMQDAAVLEVIQLVERIDAADQRHALQAAVGRDDFGDQP